MSACGVIRSGRGASLAAAGRGLVEPIACSRCGRATAKRDAHLAVDGRWLCVECCAECTAVVS